MIPSPPFLGEIALSQFGLYVALAVAGVMALTFTIIAFNYGSIWLRATASGAAVGWMELLALSLRKVPVGLVVDNRITAMKSGLEVSIDQLSTHHLSTCPAKAWRLYFNSPSSLRAASASAPDSFRFSAACRLARPATRSFSLSCALPR